MSVLCDVGLIGLGVMGRNFALNMAQKGISVAVYDRNKDALNTLAVAAAHTRCVVAHEQLKNFVAGLSRPRKIILLVNAGAPVDDVLESLVPLVERGDIIVDSGNSFFRDTERRQQQLQAQGLRYVGMGISGGEKGALIGPSLMPGGERGAVEQLMPLLRKVAAQEPEPCVAYIGAKGAGHFVKMAHNGIEYADMQLIAEIYDIAKHAYRYDNEQLRNLFQELGKTELSSYLIEITEKIFAKKESGQYLIDLISDVAHSKGTGLWTVQEGLVLGCPIPTIAAALDARAISSLQSERHALAAQRTASNQPPPKGDAFQTLRGALLVGKILAYAQGLHMLSMASKTYGYNLNLAGIARIWRGGCIIRSVLLEHIAAAYQTETLLHLLQAPYFAGLLKTHIASLRAVVSTAAASAVPTPALASALWYWDSLSAHKLPANLTAAQRDLFGAHTYERLDKPGTFHTDWDS